MKKIYLIIIFLLLCSRSFAATYYVKNGGNDSLDGLSDATAWETISKVNLFSFSAGDDVYFKCGDTWTSSQLLIDWSGTSGNYAIIGAYYMLDGNETIGVNGSKPIVDGNNDTPSSHVYSGLVRINNQTYVQIENLRVINSQGEGIEAYQGSNIIFDSNETYNTWYGGIEFWTVNTGQILNCNVSYAGMINEGGGGGTWPASLAANQYSHGVLIKGNIVHEVYGEGIGCYKYSYSNIIEYNTVYAAWAGNIYIDHGYDYDIRFNLLYGTTDSSFWRGGSVPYRGIDVNDEASQGTDYTHDIRIYGNYVAYFNKGIVISDDYDSNPTNISVYNNTIVGCVTAGFAFNDTSSSVVIKNNLFAYNDALVIGTVGSATMDYNLWSSDPGASYRGANDPGYPTYGSQTVTLYKTSGWQGMTGGDLNVSDFALDASNDGVDAAADLGTPYNVSLSENSSMTNVPFTLVTIDRNETTPWDIGANEYRGGYTPPPPTGSGVISQDAYESGCIETGVATSITIPITISADADYGIATVWWSSSVARTISSITFNSTAMTASVNLTTSTYNSSATFYILDTDMPSAGTYNLIVTMSAAPDAYLSAAMETLIGAAQQAPSATNSAHDTDNNGSVTTAITTTADNSWVVDSIQSSWAQTGTSDQTTDLMSACIRARGQSHKQVNTAGATNMVWTINGSSLYHLLLAIEPSGSGSYIDPTIDSVGIYNTSTTAYSTSESDSITAIDEYLYIALETSKQLTNNSTPESSRLVLDLESPEGMTINAAWYGHVQALGGEWLLVYQLRSGYSWEGQWVRKGFKWLTSDLQVNSIDMQDAIFKDGDGNSLDTDLTASGTDVGSITFNVPMAADYSLPEVGGGCGISNGYIQ